MSDVDHGMLQALTGIRLVEKLERIGLETIMATTASSMPPLTLQGALYSRHALKSPMAQLTSLKTAFTVHPRKKEPEKQSPAAELPLGVPGRPGCGALERGPLVGGRKQRGTSSMVRPDLGTVGGPSKRPRVEEQSTLGTISSLLFGRKGGLL
ncbi:hypothetical protein PR048_020388 [Dryococelus australis]|uniref:Uncharacterized protein n=1 Tax=Dryococelus australis TaxID=614101 RepID=A0ABQ9H654_9NEOP|nr:hypothetical protein PR048_020388 [Dryococelus australis]